MLATKNKTLRSVDFSFSNFGGVGIEFANAIAANNCLTFVGTHAAGIDEATTEAILSMVMNHSSLRDVIVGGVINARTVASLTKLLSLNSSLKGVTFTSKNFDFLVIENKI